MSRRTLTKEDITIPDSQPSPTAQSESRSTHNAEVSHESINEESSDVASLTHGSLERVIDSMSFCHVESCAVTDGSGEDEECQENDDKGTNFMTDESTTDEGVFQSVVIRDELKEFFVPSFLAKMATKYMRGEQSSVVSFEEYMLDLIVQVLRRPTPLVVLESEAKLMQEKLLKSASPKQKSLSRISLSEGSRCSQNSTSDVDEGVPFHADVRRRLFQPYLRNNDVDTFTPAADIFLTPRKYHIPSSKVQEELPEQTQEEYWTKGVINKFYLEIYSRYESDKADKELREFRNMAKRGPYMGTDMSIDAFTTCGRHTVPIEMRTAHDSKSPSPAQAKDHTLDSHETSLPVYLRLKHDEGIKTRIECYQGVGDGYRNGVYMRHPSQNPEHFEPQGSTRRPTPLLPRMPSQEHYLEPLSILESCPQQVHPLVPDHLRPWVHYLDPVSYSYSPLYGYYPNANPIQSPSTDADYTNVIENSPSLQGLGHGIQGLGRSCDCQLLPRVPIPHQRILRYEYTAVPQYEKVSHAGRRETPRVAHHGSRYFDQSNQTQHGRTYGINFDLAESRSDATEIAPLDENCYNPKTNTDISSLQKDELSPYSMTRGDAYSTNNNPSVSQRHFEQTQEPSHTSYSIGSLRTGTTDATTMLDEHEGLSQRIPIQTAQHDHLDSNLHLPSEQSDSRTLSAYDFQQSRQSQGDVDQPDVQQSTQQDSSQEYDMYRTYATETDGGRMLPFHRWHGLHCQSWRSDYNARVTARWEEERGRQRHQRR